MNGLLSDAITDCSERVCCISPRNASRDFCSIFIAYIYVSAASEEIYKPDHCLSSLLRKLCQNYHVQLAFALQNHRAISLLFLHWKPLAIVSSPPKEVEE